MGDREPALVVSARLAPAPGRDEPLLVAFRPPRRSLLVPLGSREPSAIAAAVTSIAAEDVVVLFDSETERRYDPEPYRVTLRGTRPDAEVLLFDPDQILRFFWHYRDRQDLLALAHAGKRTLFPPGVVDGEIPGHRSRKERRAIAEIRMLLVGIGASLGVHPPLPPLHPAPGGFGAQRMAGVIDAVAGLYAGMLFRFGAPIAVVGESRAGATLRLADREKR